MRVMEWPGAWTGKLRSFNGREAVLVTGVVAVVGASLLATLGYAPAAPWTAFIPLGVVLLGIAAWVVAAAFTGSTSAIIAYLAVVVFVTDGQFRVRDAGDIDMDWQSLLKFAVWAGAGVIGAGHLPSLDRLLGRTGSACWLAYIVFALLSCVYSPVPGYSLGCAFALLCLFAFSFAVITKLSESQLLWTLSLTLTAFCLVGWVVFYTYPALGTSVAWTYGGIYYRMCGIAGQANNLGAVCIKAIGVAFLLWYSGRCRLLTALVLGGIGIATLLGSNARTGMIAIAVGVAAVILSRSRWAMAGGFLAVLVAYIASQSQPHVLDSLGSLFSRSGDPSELYTLTGRLEIWDFVWRKVLEQPWLGWGYNSSKTILGQNYGFTNGLMVDTAHNLYLQNLLSVGFFGMLPLVALLVWMCVKFLTRPVSIVTYFLVAILVSSVSDTDAVGTTPTVMTLLFMIISIWPEPARAYRPRTMAALA